MIYKKLKGFISSKEEKLKKEKLIQSILSMAEGKEKEIFKKKEMDKLNLEELENLKKELEIS